MTEEPIVRKVHWVSQHEQGTPDHGINCGLIFEIPESKILDGMPSPRCPWECSIPNHRMTPVSSEDYHAIMDTEDDW